MVRRSGTLRTLSAALLLTAASAFTASDARAEIPTRTWSEQTDGCVLTLEEYESGSYRLRLRAPDVPPEEGCPAFVPELAEGVARLLRQAAPAGDVTISLGRVLEIPTLSAELVLAARSSSGWDSRHGRPCKGDPNAFVAGVLRRSAVLRELLPGLDLVGVNVEKVLVPTKKMIRERKQGDGVPDERLPYDAQFWVRLRQKP